jgi:WD40 repeat protein
VVAVLDATLAGEAGGFSAAAFSPDGKTLALGTNKGLIKLWDAENWKERKALSGHSGLIARLTFYPSGRYLGAATATRQIAFGERFRDGTARLWDLKSEAEPVCCSAAFCDLVVAISPDSSMLATGADGGTADQGVRLYRITQEGKLQPRALEKNETSVLDVTFSPDSKTVVASGRDRITRFWDADTGKASLVGELYFPRFPHSSDALRNLRTGLSGKARAA